MKIKVTLEQEDFDSLSDILHNALENTEKTSETKLTEIWNLLDDNIQGCAIQWGTNDTVFVDEFYDFIKENILTIKTILNND